MAITLNLAPEQEARLREKARRQGREAENYAAEIILRDINWTAKEIIGASMPEPGQSLAEALEGLIGVLDSSQKNGGQVSHIAENTGEEFTKTVVEKHKAGHL